jgi:hypothetical protein
MTRIRSLAMAVAGAATIAVPLAGGPAQAATVGNGPVQAQDIHTVCADSLYVRDKPAGVVIGTLFRGDSFDYSHSDGNGWDYGYAFGHVNKPGWVQAGWFC